jgi:hypothetical protein
MRARWTWMIRARGAWLIWAGLIGHLR